MTHIAPSGARKRAPAQQPDRTGSASVHLLRMGMFWLAGSFGPAAARAVRLPAGNLNSAAMPQSLAWQGLVTPKVHGESSAAAPPTSVRPAPDMSIAESFEDNYTPLDMTISDASFLDMAVDESHGGQRALLVDIPGRRRPRRGTMRRETQRYELVLSRYSERLEWLRSLPDFWKITVYNTGANDTPIWSDRPFEVVALQNQALGREGYAYAHHFSTRYATLADYTVCSQAAPFEHNANFAQMLHHPAMLNNVQAMSTMFTDTIPPKDIRDRFSPDPWFRPDKFSLRTMDSLFFEDCCIHTAGLAYAARFNVTEGTNLINHLLTSIGVRDFIPEASEVGVFPYGGMFGVAKRNVQQHPREVYERLVPKLLEHIQVGYLMERTWLIIFGGRSFIE